MKIKWPKVLNFEEINAYPIIRWIDLCNGTMFRITAFFSHLSKEHPISGLFIGIERKGAFLFSFYENIGFEYVEEKLNLCEADARPIADWINAQLGNEIEQYGTYQKHYIDQHESVSYIGERSSLPLIPNIVEDIKHET